MSNMERRLLLLKEIKYVKKAINKQKKKLIKDKLQFKD